MYKTLFLVAFIVFAVNANVVDVSLSLSSETYTAGDELRIQYSMKSNRGLGQMILRWNNPLHQTEDGEFNGNMFTVTHSDGSKATYKGRIIMRTEPIMEDFVLVPSFGNGIQGEMILNNGYHFEKEGTYTISLNLAVSTISGNSIVMSSNEVQVNVVAADVEETRTDRLPRNSRSTTINYQYCSISQKSVVETAITNAITASYYAWDSLDTVGGSSSQYQTFFGNPSIGRVNTCKTGFATINTNLNDRALQGDCSTCDQTQPANVLAYVYPTNTCTHNPNNCHMVYFCATWFSSTPQWNHNYSQPGVLSHEMSHFNDVWGTDDYVYGTYSCKQLAINDPNTAVMNADNVRLFQESDPSNAY